jgi:PAS domain S-box-containing protein
MNFLNNILNAGIDANLDKSLAPKVRLSNGVAVLFVGTALFYVVVAAVYVPVIIPYVLAAGALFLFVPFLNKARMYDLSRFIASINASLVSFFIHTGMITEAEEPLLGNYVVQAAFMLLPWVLYDMKSKFWLGLAFSITVASLLLVRPLNGLLEPPAINPMIRSLPLEYINLGTACFIMGVLMYFVQSFSSGTQLENEVLIRESSIKNNELEANEQKLNEYIQQIEVSRIEDKRREWSSNGLAKFAEILRANNESLSVTYDRIISNLVKYISANQGALYIYEKNDGEEFLEMVSCYAYDRKKFILRKFDVGEGLIGQCYLEKDVVYMTSVPQNYTFITSGLGDATPRNIVLVPLIVNEATYGVVELASFHMIENHQIEFLQKVGESIASAVSSLKIAEKTQVLLKQTLEQTEMMRAQEEEMRQSMEELHATQEEMMRKSIEVETPLTVMNDCGIAYAEMALDGLFLKSNDAFRKRTGFSNAELKGRNVYEMIKDEDGNNVHKSKLLAYIKEEGTHKGAFEVETKSGDRLKFSGGFTAILNASNIPQKIVCILH